MRKYIFLLIVSLFLIHGCFDNKKEKEVVLSPDEIAFNTTLDKANKGDVKSMLNVSDLYFQGKGTKANLEQGISWLNKAGEAKDIAAMAKLAQLYSDGVTVPVDKELSHSWLVKAGEAGDKESQYKLAVFYSDSEGKEPDFKTAYSWYLKAAEQNHPEALFDIGWFSYEGKNGFAQNVPIAVQYWEKAAAVGSVRAMSKLGYIYNNGYGTEIPADKTKAFDYYLKASEKNNAEAQYFTGIIYINGGIVDRNLITAYKWLLLAKENGQKNADGVLSMVKNQMKEEELKNAEMQVDEFLGRKPSTPEPGKKK